MMTMNYKSITLKRNKDNSLKRFHPWVFSGAIARMDKGISDGDTVNIFNCEGNYIATGHYGLGSIAVRVLTFSGEEIDSSFWRKKIGEASALRKITVNNKNTDMFRLVHGEGDCLPGLVVDVYGHTAVMQAHSTGMHRSRYEIAQAIVDVMNGQINSVYYKSNTTLPFAEENDNIDGFLIGKVSKIGRAHV